MGRHQDTAGADVVGLAVVDGAAAEADVVDRSGRDDVVDGSGLSSAEPSDEHAADEATSTASVARAASIRGLVRTDSGGPGMSMMGSVSSPAGAEPAVAPPLQLVREANVGARAGGVRRSSDIVLVTEGTYPHAHGGVSVWCDQLVSGLPDHTFRLVALTAFGYQRPVWKLPAHVAELMTVGLWDRVPSGRGSATAPLARVLAGLLAAPGDDVARFGRFLDEVAALDGAEVGRQLAFGPLVRALDIELARPRDHGEATRGARASDLVKVAGMLEHLLRPLSLDPGPAAIYHASSNGLAALVGLVAQRRHGARFVLTEHGIYLRERYLELRRLAMARPAKAMLLRFHRLVSGAAYADADTVAPGSRWNQRWETRHGTPPHRFRPIYNGIDPSEFSPRDEEPPEPVVSWLGRIDPIKDLETLVEAFAVVNASRPDARLRLYGRTPAGSTYRVKLDELIVARGLEGVVTFEGGVEASADAYRDAQVGVLSSISEGFPYSLIEAMACGLPAVATGVGGVAEAVADTGIVVPPRAPELLGEAVLELLEDTPRRQKLGFMARERVLELFTLEGCLDAYRTLYGELRARWAPVVSLAVAGCPGLPAPSLSPAPSSGDGRQPRSLTPRVVLARAHRDELTAALGGVDALVQAVDADDVAATLESVGVTDDVAATRFGTPDVFVLAERMWSYASMLRRAGRIFRSAGGDGGGGGGGEPAPGAEAAEPPRPPLVLSPWPEGALIRGLAYVLPAVVVAAAVRGGADQTVLVASSVLGWGLGHAGGVLAYTVHYRAPQGRGLAPLWRGLLGAVVAILLGACAVGWARSPAAGVAFALPLLHLVGATAVVMAGHTRLLLALLCPAAALSTVAVVDPDGRLVPAVGPAAMATVLATLTVVAWFAFRSTRAAKGGPTAAELLERADWVLALPLAICGWLTAVFALLAVGAVGHLPGFAVVGSGHWLLVALPLWVMVAVGEWLLLSLRRVLAIDLEASASLGTFRATAGRAVTGWLGAGLAGLLLAVVAGAAGLVGSSDLTWLVAASAAAIFALVAAALFGATVLTSAARAGSVVAAMAVAVVALGWVANSPRNPFGLGDHAVALGIGGAVAAVLCVRAGLVLLDPGTHR